MPAPSTPLLCADAAMELAEKFKYEDWFLGTYASKLDDGQEVIYFKYKKRNPEKQRLYLYHGYPILMREVKTAMARKISDAACKGK